MKNAVIVAIVGICGGVACFSSCTGSQAVKDYTAYVNPFVGTGGHGHTFPGPVVPHGMVQPSPDTRIDGWDAPLSTGSRIRMSAVRDVPITVISF